MEAETLGIRPKAATYRFRRPKNGNGALGLFAGSFPPIILGKPIWQGGLQ
jgi:hypothetical protein